MQRLEVSGAVRPLYGSLGVKGLMKYKSSDINLICLYSRTIKCLTPYYMNRGVPFTVSLIKETHVKPR